MYQNTMEYLMPKREEFLTAEEVAKAGSVRCFLHPGMAIEKIFQLTGKQ